MLDVRLLDESGAEVEPGMAGEITARGDTVMKGYWRDPERTARVLRDGWFRTGDIAYQDGDGYLYIVDRRVDIIINSGGINVYSLELERTICELPAVRDCVVIGVPDPLWGEAVAAVVVTEPGGAVTPEEVIAYCVARLASYKKPRQVHVRESIRLNAMGKPDKRAVRAEFWVGQDRLVNG
jgi:long-chain acyl-CoA synthetase